MVNLMLYSNLARLDLFQREVQNYQGEEKEEDINGSCSRKWDSDKCCCKY